MFNFCSPLVSESSFLDQVLCKKFSGMLLDNFKSNSSILHSNWSFIDSLPVASLYDHNTDALLNTILFNVFNYHKSNFNCIHHKRSGFEWWFNINSQQDWHIDKDERLYSATKKTRPALFEYASCTMSSASRLGALLSSRSVAQRCMSSPRVIASHSRL